MNTFEDYILNCARAFGACSHQIEDACDEPPRLRVVHPNYRLAELNAKLARLKTASGPDIAKEYLARESNNYIKAINAATDLIIKYTNILEEVNAWVPPTEEHLGLKAFAIEQLQNKMARDSDTSCHYRALSKLEAMTYEEIYEKLVCDCLSDISAEAEKYKKEIESARASNNWIKALRESIK